MQLLHTASATLEATDLGTTPLHLACHAGGHVPLAQWQAAGEDKGSTVGAFPADDEVIGWAKKLLSF